MSADPTPIDPVPAAARTARWLPALALALLLGACGGGGADPAPTQPQPQPQPQALPDGQTVAAGLRHAVFVRADGSVQALGDNPGGRLGDGSTATVLQPLNTFDGLALPQ